MGGEAYGSRPVGQMESQELKDFLNGFRSQKLYTVNARINDEDFRIPAKIRLQKQEDGSVNVKVHPIQRLHIPDEYMGDVIGDLNSRRGRVQGMDSIGHHQIIKGQVPLAEILKYAPDLRSMTSGRGTFTYEHSHYEEVPAQFAEKIIAERKHED